MRRRNTFSTINEQQAIEMIRAHSRTLENHHDLEPLMKRIGDARIVMLGEASHGTHEYYTWRSHLSKKLITEKGFNIVAVEGDWPDCYLVNTFVKSSHAAAGVATAVLQSFDRWPTWMWANWEVAAFVEWLKGYNGHQLPADKAGFYGLDVYSLWESMEAIMRYLETHDRAALDIAKEAYNCFEPHRKGEGQSYARALQFVPDTCEEEVVELLKQIQQKVLSGSKDGELIFNVEQNALVTVNAERYYRAMLAGGAASWNVRDQHMNETLERLLELHGPGSKAIVWEHNTHIGDARATDMADDGMVNIGELARQQHNGEVVLVGFGSYEGTVIAGRAWGAPMQVMDVPPAREGSWEYLMHKAAAANQLLLMEDLNDPLLMENHIDQRAIGVVYNPAYERYGNYVPSVMSMRYDAFIHIDHSSALHPLKITPDKLQMPETYPFGV